MNISPISVLLVMIMCLCTASCLEGKEEQERNKGKKCKFPKGNAGSVLTDGCIKSTCSNGKWKAEVRSDICCNKQVDGLHEKVDGLEKNIENMDETIKTQVDGLYEKVDGLEKNIDNMDKTIETQVDGLNEKVNGLTENLLALTELVKDSISDNNEALLEIKGQNTILTQLMNNHMKADPQCGRSYTTLTDDWRRIEYGVKHPSGYCDKTGSDSYYYTNLAAGWYRFSFPSAPYAKIPTTAPLRQYVGNDRQSCGTYAVAWMEDSLPEIGQAPKDVKIHFAYDYTGYPKHWSSSAKIVACPAGEETMYLYYLPPTPDCNLAYCAL